MQNDCVMKETEENQAERYYHSLPIQIRFNDVDRYGHVNNNSYFAYYDLGKEEYLRKLQGFYDIAGTPALFILEVIDSSYTIEDENFPCQIRLDSKDIERLFPNADIGSWETYRYPQNKRTKRLYIIRKKQ